MAITLCGKKLGGLATLTLLLATILFAGCQSPEKFNAQLAKIGATKTNTQGVDIIKPDDLLIVTFSDMPPPVPAPTEERVKNDGTLRLMHNQTFKAAGKTRTQLEQEIHDRYVPKYYLNLTATVKHISRYYWVEGMVKNPSKQEYIGPTTVVGAIASAGGFNEFAKTSAVKVIHQDGTIDTVNFKRALTDPQRYDLPVYPGDKVHVDRKLF